MNDIDPRTRRYRCGKFLLPAPFNGPYLMFFRKDNIEVGGELCSSCFYDVERVLFKEV